MPETFPERLDALINECAREMVPEHQGEMPVVTDYILVVACDDVHSIDSGGTYMNAKPNSPIFRSVGLLHEGLRMLYMAQIGG